MDQITSFCKSLRRYFSPVGRLLLITAVAGFGNLTGCTVAQQQQFAADTQQIANTIRQAETLAWTPAQFNAYLQSALAFFPSLGAYVPEVELGYAALYASGDLSVKGLEGLATRYDDKPASTAASPAHGAGLSFTFLRAATAPPSVQSSAN